MRIISGSARGRRLFAPGKTAIRPTSDRVREALFNIIGPPSQDMAVLDLYAGTGALGIEALSRGAGSALFVDKHPQAVSLIEKNISLCGFSEKSRVIMRDLVKGLSFLSALKPAAGFALIFVDPPYGKGFAHCILTEIAGHNLVAAGGLIIVEDKAGTDFPERIGALTMADQRRYGDTGLWLYRGP